MIEGWMQGRIVVEFRCGVRVMESRERMTYQDGTVGPVHYVYQKRFYYRRTDSRMPRQPQDYQYEWSRDSRIFERDDAVREATRRVQFEEAMADHDPNYRVVWLCDEWIDPRNTRDSNPDRSPGPSV